MNSFLPERADAGPIGRGESRGQEGSSRALCVAAPTRQLRPHPSISTNSKRQAKELLDAFFHSGNAKALSEVQAHYRGAKADTFALHDAQLVIAHTLPGFDSWPQLKALCRGPDRAEHPDKPRRTRITGSAPRRRDTIVAWSSGDIATLRRLLERHPRIAGAEYWYAPAVHFAAREGHVEAVRLLLDAGADPRTERPEQSHADRDGQRAWSPAGCPDARTRSRSGRDESSRTRQIVLSTSRRDAGMSTLSAALLNARCEPRSSRRPIRRGPASYTGRFWADRSRRRERVARPRRGHACAAWFCGLARQRTHQSSSDGPGRMSGRTTAASGILTSRGYSSRAERPTTSPSLPHLAIWPPCSRCSMTILPNHRDAPERPAPTLGGCRIRPRRHRQASCWSAAPTARWEPAEAVHAASSRGNFAMLKLLLEHGADPNEEIDSTSSPLAFAATPSVRSLLEYGPGAGLPYL